MSEIRPFKIAVPEGELAKLKAKLNAASLPPETAFSNDWERGSPRADVKRLVARWREGFDWRAAEAELNKIPQFTTSVDVDGFGSMEMHFIHHRSQDENAIPLLFCHGCSSVSFFSFSPDFVIMANRSLLIVRAWWLLGSQEITPVTYISKCGRAVFSCGSTVTSKLWLL